MDTLAVLRARLPPDLGPPRQFGYREGNLAEGRCPGLPRAGVANQSGFGLSKSGVRRVAEGGEACTSLIQSSHATGSKEGRTILHLLTGLDPSYHSIQMARQNAFTVLGKLVRITALINEPDKELRPESGVAEWFAQAA